MDCVALKTFAKFGKPTAVGHIGTVIVSPPNQDGEVLVEFTLRRKGMRQLNHPDYRVLDGRKRKRNTDRR